MNILFVFNDQNFDFLHNNLPEIEKSRARILLRIIINWYTYTGHVTLWSQVLKIMVTVIFYFFKENKKASIIVIIEAFRNLCKNMINLHHPAAALT
ncbi:MAG: hypothetical protein D5R98_06605 [Desulfonatronovibrio sp. MSAO_Bac4]|nr:MAG: hypothetical protein D5R98_06605 [Desulfonatronovibrio sp. MSAO_Bac4]